MSRYALVLIFSGIVPFFLSFFQPLRFYKNQKALVYTFVFILFIFGGWDIFTAWRGHRYFNSAAVWPTRIINLPLEEVIFFIVIPFCCIFTWEAIKFIKTRIR